MRERTHLGILCDSRLVAEALSLRLDREDGNEVVATAASLYDLLVRAKGRPIDVLLVYLHVRTTLAVEICWDIKTLLPAARVVVLGCDRSGGDAVTWIEAGATARLEYDASYESLLEAIRAACGGRVLCPPDVVTEVTRRIVCLEKDRDRKVLPTHSLTARESEAVQWVQLGLSDKEVARRLGCRLPTTKHLVAAAIRKLGHRGRGALDLRRTGGRNGRGGDEQ